ncbi:MAG TPA: ParB/RepB/Spo0J family partition protein [Clostridiaceae bacterium]|nr:ParB/RepB/Spo0J family partition protein [Clostridiaceae bacterium]
MAKRALGKGLGALIPQNNEASNGIIELKLADIEPNMDQPRKAFDDEKLLKLADSIKEHGVVQPIIVKKDGNVYRIVAGERRWRAARIAKIETIPAIVKDLTEKQLMEIALIENLQREDLNPIEEAEAYEKLIKEHNMTQEEISRLVGKSRPAIANSLRLLNLNEKIKETLIKGDITEGHARALLSLDNQQSQLKVLDEIIKNKLSVRDTEKLVKKLSSVKTSPRKSKQLSPEFERIEENLRNILGTKVKLFHQAKKGKIMIEYYSNEELDRIVDLLNSLPKKTTL